jgi:hypothetical protein
MIENRKAGLTQDQDRMEQRKRLLEQAGKKLQSAVEDLIGD